MIDLEKRKEHHQKILELLNQSDEFEYRLGKDTVEYLNEFLNVYRLVDRDAFDKKIGNFLEFFQKNSSKLNIRLGYSILDFIIDHFEKEVK